MKHRFVPALERSRFAMHSCQARTELSGQATERFRAPIESSEARVESFSLVDRTFPPVGGTFQGADLKCAVMEEGFPSCSRQRRCFFKVQTAEGKYFLAGISKTVRPLVARKLK